MNFTKTAVTLGIAALAAMAAPVAMAQGTGWYAGGNFGSTGVTIDDERIRNGLAGQGLGTSSIDERDQDKGYKVFGGYQFHPNFGVEAGYFDLGRFGYTANATPSGSLTGDIRIKGLNLDLVGTLPLTQRFSAFARVGVNYARTEGRFSAVPLAQVPYPSSSTSERATNVKYGLGLAYAFNESWSMRVEAERYHIKDSVGNKGHADMISAGLVYRFGARP